MDIGICPVLIMNPNKGRLKVFISRIPLTLLTINLSKKDDWTTTKQTTRRIQLWGRNRQFIGLTSWEEEEEEEDNSFRLGPYHSAFFPQIDFPVMQFD
jgi:hypothetical protein